MYDGHHRVPCFYASQKSKGKRVVEVWCSLANIKKRSPMGDCLSFKTHHPMIYGPFSLQNSPITFRQDEKLWAQDYNYFVDNVAESNLPKSIIAVVLGFVKDDLIQQMHLPKHFIMTTAIHESKPSLQPYKLEKYSKQDWINECGDQQRVSYSIFDQNIINGQIIKDTSGIYETMPSNIKDDYIVQHKFHEIVVYKTGGKFDPHIDTIFYDKDSKVTYNFTLILIPPNDYEGGQLVLYHKSDIITISCDEKKWKWILFHKEIKHECKRILSGVKIAFKFHVALKKVKTKEDRMEQARSKYFPLEDSNIVREPLATGDVFTIPKGEDIEHMLLSTSLHDFVEIADEAFQHRMEFGND